jgi:polyhydroxyalkanoate synthesis repressor PhaR
MEQGRESAPPATTRTIKRYANRKLYDMTDSSYVTLEEIAQFVKNGEEVRILDNKTKEDLTAVTLTQIIFEEEKRRKRILPLATLRGVIQSGGEFIHRRIAEPVASFREEAERTVATLRGEAEKTMGRLVKLEGIDELREAMKEFIDNTHGVYDDFQKRLDERVRVVLGNIPLSGLGKELDHLKKKVNQLERALTPKLTPKPTPKPPPKTEDKPGDEG